MLFQTSVLCYATYMRIGVFDSGIGGKAVADELQRLLPHAEILFVSDPANVPYGGRPRHEIFSLTHAAIQPLLKAQCDAIVLACNTATTNAIQLLRAAHPTQKFIGLEPMIKPAAALTQSHIIAVLATPATLESPRYQALKKEFASTTTVLEPNCADWAQCIEENAIDAIPLEETIKPLVAQDVDVIVLGCTHYHWLKEAIETIAGPGVQVLEPTNAIKNRLDDIISPTIVAPPQ